MNYLRIGSICCLLGPACALGLSAESPSEPAAVHHANNDKFTSPDLDYSEWRSRFESRDREVFQFRQAIVDVLTLHHGETVADVGAGTGAMLEPLVAAVGPQGTVIATELSEGFRQGLTQRATDQGWATVQVRSATPTSTGLSPDEVDAVLMVDVYHHLEDKPATLADLGAALKSSGRMLIVDFDPGADGASDWVKGHVHQTAEEVIAEVVATGLFDHEPEPKLGLTENRALLFTKR